MARKPEMPSEFAHFLRDIGIRAFDHVASRLEEEVRADEGLVRKLARQWNTLPAKEKERFFGYVVSAAELAVTAAPALSIGLATAAKVRRATQRKKAPTVAEGAPRRYYDASEAEATLPPRGRKKKKASTVIDVETVSKSETKSGAKKKPKKA